MEFQASKEPFTSLAQRQLFPERYVNLKLYLSKDEEPQLSLGKNVNLNLDSSLPL